MMRLGGKEVEWLHGLTHALRQLPNGFMVQPVHWRDDPACDDAWADREAVKVGGRKSRAWRQNMEMELVRGGDPVYGMLDRAYHVRIIPRGQYLSADWAVWRSLDHGIRHPTCCAWAAVHRNGDKYFFRQFYRTDTPIAALAKQIQDADGDDEGAVGTVADSQLWTRDPKDMETYVDTYAKNGLPLILADKARVGYETVMTGFLSSAARWALGRNDLALVRDMLSAPTLTVGDVERIAAKPAIWFHPSCAQGPISLYEQCANLRYREHHNPLHTAEPDKPEDKDDEGPDVVRYMCQTAAVQWEMPRRRATHDLIDDLLTLHAAKAGKETSKW